MVALVIRGNAHERESGRFHGGCLLGSGDWALPRLTSFLKLTRIGPMHLETK